MKFTNIVTIHTPIELVFSYLAQPENIPKWNYAIAQTNQTSAGAIGVGAEFRQTRIIPRHATESFRITEFTPSSRLTFDGDFGPFTGTSSYSLTQGDANETILTNTFELQAAGVVRMMSGILSNNIKKAVEKNLYVLKDILEQS